MKGGVVTKLRLIVFLPIILVLWDDKGTLAGSVPQMHDSRQFSKFLVLDKSGGKKSLIEIEGKTERKESVQKQTGRQQIESRNSRKAQSDCKDVTFGECRIPPSKILKIVPESTIEKCPHVCSLTTFCSFYRFNHQTKECILLRVNYKHLCRIRAAPVEMQTSTCLTTKQPCGAHGEEECEYTGNDVRRYPPGEISDSETCQDSCQNSAPTCKYWIYNHIERACIHKGEGTRICNAYGGLKRYADEECRKFLEEYEK